MTRTYLYLQFAETLTANILSWQLRCRESVYRRRYKLVRHGFACCLSQHVGMINMTSVTKTMHCKKAIDQVE